MILASLASDGDVFRCWATGDWHIGQDAHDAVMFDRHYRAAVEGKYALLHLGDALEMVTVSSGVAHKGALNDQRLSTESQRECLVSLLRNYPGDQIILPGNHEFRIDAKTGLDFMKTICDAVGPRATVLSQPGIIRIRVRKQVYYVEMHHGEGPVVSPITLLDRLQRDTEGVDVILAAHIHASTFDPAEVMTPEGERVVLRLRTGHYLKTPRYTLVRPIARIGARGSYVLSFSGVEHGVSAEWQA